MEPIEDLLRHELRTHKGLPVMPETMVARVRKVRRRRTAVTAGFAAVALGALGVTATNFLPSPAGLPVGGALPQRMHQVMAINAVFTDHDHGYVVQERCSMDPPGEVPEGAPTPDIHQDCRTQLLVTSDAGNSWQERTLPGDPATKDAGVDIALGHSLMLWVDSPGTVALGGWDLRYWTTGDGGLTWQESSTPRQVAPQGSIHGFGPDDKLAILANGQGQGPRVGEKNPLVAADDGSFWAACGSSAACVKYTRDLGQTWQTAAIPVAAAIDWVATADGQNVYAATRDAMGPHLVRSTDGGATWAEVPGITGLPERGADGLALANGDLLMSVASEQGGLYRLKAGTTTVELLTTAPAHPNSLFETGGVIVGAPAWDQRETADISSVVSISPDNGTTWLPVPVPAP